MSRGVSISARLGGLGLMIHRQPKKGLATRLPLCPGRRNSRDRPYSSRGALLAAADPQCMSWKAPRRAWPRATGWQLGSVADRSVQAAQRSTATSWINALAVVRRKQSSQGVLYIHLPGFKGRIGFKCEVLDGPALWPPAAGHNPRPPVTTPAAPQRSFEAAAG